MRVIGNLLWVCLGGAILALGWMVAGLLLCLTIIGIPFGIQCFKIAGFVIWPFGKGINYGNIGVGSTLMNLIWIIVFGWELAIASLTIGIFYCLTIIGIPFGIQCFKFVQLALFPFGASLTQRRIF